MKTDKKTWKVHNEMLQRAYNDYLHSTCQREKDSALYRIQKELEWGPFMDLCEKENAYIYGISKYGLDYISECCINKIDKISKEEIDSDL